MASAWAPSGGRQHWPLGARWWGRSRILLGWLDEKEARDRSYEGLFARALGNRTRASFSQMERNAPTGHLVGSPG